MATTTATTTTTTGPSASLSLCAFLIPARGGAAGARARACGAQAANRAGTSSESEPLRIDTERRLGGAGAGGFSDVRIVRDTSGANQCVAAEEVLFRSRSADAVLRPDRQADQLTPASRRVRCAARARAHRRSHPLASPPAAPRAKEPTVPSAPCSPPRLCDEGSTKTALAIKPAPPPPPARHRQPRALRPSGGRSAGRSGGLSVGRAAGQPGSRAVGRSVGRSPSDAC